MQRWREVRNQMQRLEQEKGLGRYSPVRYEIVTSLLSRLPIDMG